MSLLYNQIAGQSLGRVAALSDGVFAIAMTLIVLELRLPETAHITSNGELARALAALAPQLLTYLLSFLTLGIFWTGQQTQLQVLNQSDRNLTWLHFAFLAVTTLMPFSTRLLTEHPKLQVALAAYWLNIAVMGWLLYATWSYAGRAGLVRDLSPELDRAMRRRILSGQVLYVLSLALSLLGTTWGIAAFVLVQLNFAAAPRVRWLYWL